MVFHLLCKIRQCKQVLRSRNVWYPGVAHVGSRCYWDKPRLISVTSRPTLLASELTGRDPPLVTIEFLLLAVHVSLGGLTIQVKIHS